MRYKVGDRIVTTTDKDVINPAFGGRIGAIVKVVDSSVCEVVFDEGHQPDVGRSISHPEPWVINEDMIVGYAPIVPLDTIEDVERYLHE